MFKKYLDILPKAFTHSKDRNSTNHFIRQLSVLLNADFTLYNSLQIINNQHSTSYSTNFKTVLQRLMYDLHAGISFNEALSKYQDLFSPVVITLIKVGEESGNLKKVLDELTHYLNHREKYRKKIQSALSYPAVVLTIALLTVIFMMVFLLPTFTEMFRDFGMELPGFTKLLISISSFLIHYGWVVIIAIVIFYVFMKKQLSKLTIQGKIFQWFPNIPIIGKVIIQAQLQLFSSVIATLLENGVAMLDTLKICQDVAKSRIIKGYFGFVIKRFSEGENLSEAMKIFEILPDETVHLIAMGEESAKLPMVFRKIDETMGKEIELFLDGLTSILEPLIIVIMGLIVGTILIGMYLPIFEMSTNLF